MAETRETQVLEDVVESTEIENPRTTEEAILAKIIAGEEVNINVRTRYQAYLKELSSIGGGNPNYVEIVTGTLVDPWGDHQASELLEEYKANNCTVYVEIDAAALGKGKVNSYMGHWTSYPTFLGVSGGSAASDWSGTFAVYDISGNLSYARILQNSSVIDVTAYASALPTTLTIIHHPLPEDNA